MGFVDFLARAMVSHGPNSVIQAAFVQQIISCQLKMIQMAKVLSIASNFVIEACSRLNPMKVSHYPGTGWKV